MNLRILLLVAIATFQLGEGKISPKLTPTGFDNALELTFSRDDGSIILQGQLGVASASAVGMPTICSPGEHDICYQYGDFARFYSKTNPDNCTTLEWQSTFARRLEDCFDILPGAHWYGGGETWDQPWPIEDQIRRESPVVAADSVTDYGSVTENYWLVSTGAAIQVTDHTPLFTSWRSVHAGKFCLVAKNEHPYHERQDLTLKYDICIGDNIKDVQIKAIGKYYAKPTGSPDEGMLLYPFWSTWAQYKEAINQSLVLDLARRVISEGFQLSSHIEIDDHWETCYGEREFNLVKFPDPKAMVDELRAMNLRTTLWVHPFVNYDCPSFYPLLSGGNFIQDLKEKPGFISWWQGNYAGVFDFTKPEVVTSWKSRLEKLQTDFGIDSFKFDAGETNLIPYSNNFTGDPNNQPNLFTTKYVQAVAEFGPMVEVRSGRRTQDLPIFTRMLDKDSRWGYDNGLRSLIPTLLQFAVLGYPFVLPDMIGGNQYNGEKPDSELYVRWMQANAFMPAVQFSIVPWDYGTQVVEITRAVLALREQYKHFVLEAVAEAVADGTPINRPIWWIDPEDPETYTIDDEYVLGDDILVAPVLHEGALTRDIYLPKGTWVSNYGVTYTGPIHLYNFPAPLEVLPFFVKTG